jgi:predicted acetyltransferase
VTLEIRASEFASLDRAQRLGVEAFGGSPREVAEEDWPSANVRPWSAWQGDELVAVLGVRSFSSWFHGAQVPTAGIAGVTVRAEHRGNGAVRPLFERGLADAREQGAVISTLYPTAAGIYRGLGYEVIGSFDTVTVPLSALARVSAPAGITVRRASVEDAEAVHHVYATWAAAHNGPLTRTDAPFTMGADDLFGPDSGSTGLTLALDGADVVGFASWTRGEGYDGTGALEVDDLVALTPDAARALWRVFASFDPVLGSARVRTSGGWSDPGRLVLPDHRASVTQRPYMLRLLDVPGALGAARVAPMVARVPFTVADPRTPDLEGDWLLEAADGRVRVSSDSPDPAPTDRIVLTSGGLSASYAGSLSAAAQRQAGLLTGPTTHDAAWDALWRSRDVHVRDYF